MSDKPVRHWTLESQETLFSGFYQIDRLRFRHSLHQGGSTPILDRELFLRGNVTGVLPYDPVTDQVALIEQFRIGAMHQNPDPWLTEIIAGMIEPGEAPEEVAVRESKEEAGLTLDKVELIAHYLGSPGATTEEVFIYYAETDLSTAGGVYGLDQENEDILVKIVSADEAIGMLDSRQVRNALSIIALQWFRHRRVMQGA
ncbi:MAG: NUDIX domain-containing protein [Granulosicoccus sp.]